MTTKIKARDQLRDNDKRQNGRIIEVLDVTDTHVHYHTGKRAATIKLDRIFTDGKARQRGFNLVPSEPQYQAPDSDGA